MIRRQMPLLHSRGGTISKLQVEGRRPGEQGHFGNARCDWEGQEGLTVKIVSAVRVDDGLVSSAGLRHLAQPRHSVPRERETIKFDAVNSR